MEELARLGIRLRQGLTVEQVEQEISTNLTRLELQGRSSPRLPRPWRQGAFWWLLTQGVLADNERSDSPGSADALPDGQIAIELDASGADPGHWSRVVQRVPREHAEEFSTLVAGIFTPVQQHLAGTGPEPDPALMTTGLTPLADLPPLPPLHPRMPIEDQLVLLSTVGLELRDGVGPDDLPTGVLDAAADRSSRPEDGPVVGLLHALATGRAGTSPRTGSGTSCACAGPAPSPHRPAPPSG